VSQAVVVYAHPCYDSFAASMRVAAVAGLVRAGHEVTVLDLHRDGLDITGPIPEDHLDALAGAEVFVLVYPTWWGGQPAILTAWLGLIVDLPNRGLPRARRVIAVTSHGSSKLSNALGGRPGYHVLRQFTAIACAPRATRNFIGFYEIDTADAAARTAFLDRVTERLSATR
jgi:putative NADPH-quinone reductase